MPTLKELEGQHVKLLDDTRAILLNEKCTAEDLAAADRMRKEAEGLRTRIMSLREIDAAVIAPADGKSGGARQPAPENTEDFKDFGDYIQSVKTWVKTQGRAVDKRFKFFDEGLNIKDMSGLTAAAGGALLPLTQQNTIMGVAAPLTVVRRGATVIPTSTRTVRIPVVDQTGTTANQPAFFGGLLVYWQEEATPANQTDGKFRQAEFNTRELIGYTVVSNSLLADADPALAAFLAGPRGFAGAIAWKEDWSFLRGSGVNEPLGILNSPATKSTASRTTSSHIKYDDLVAMEAGFLGQNPVWIASISTKNELMLMNGPSGNPSYLWGNSVTGVPNTLLGHPIYFTDKLPALGTAGDIMLADLSMYLIFDRQAITVDTSDQFKFSTNQTALRVIERVEGAPWLSSVITLADGSTTVSPFVIIPT